MYSKRKIETKLLWLKIPLHDSYNHDWKGIGSNLSTYVKAKATGCNSLSPLACEPGRV